MAALNRWIGLCAAAMLGLARARLAPLPPEPSSVPPPASVVAFVASHRAPSGGRDAPLTAQEAGALHHIIAGARVIGFGETGHGSQEPSPIATG
jgi:hypothetical protein